MAHQGREDLGGVGSLIEPLPGFFEKPHKESGDGGWTGENFNLAVENAHGVPYQRARRRAGGDRTVPVVDAAVAGAHEQLRSLDPPDGAPQMSAVDGEGHEFVMRFATEPCGGLAGDAGPG